MQPTGPYSLTGYSFGATVAFAMAQALQNAGERVEQLVLLDPPPPHPASERSGSVLAGHVSALLPDRPREQIDAAVAAAIGTDPAEQLAILTRRLALTAPADAFTLQRLPVLLRHHRALANWRPRGTVARLHLVQSAAAAGHHLDGWMDRGHSAGRSVVPGDHHTMLSDAALADLVGV
ncbi:thioesterase domain-containing protein [Streptomyces sp. NPDC002755]